MSRSFEILATSRERLSLQGEIVLPLRVLSYTQVESQTSKSDAVRLFIQSARRIDICFELTEEDICHIGHICQTVEGIPLAIELAADWIDQLSPAQIADEIDKGHTLLETAANTPPLDTAA